MNEEDAIGNTFENEIICSDCSFASHMDICLLCRNQEYQPPDKEPGQKDRGT